MKEEEKEDEVDVDFEVPPRIIQDVFDMSRKRKVDGNLSSSPDKHAVEGSMSIGGGTARKGRCRFVDEGRRETRRGSAFYVLNTPS
ncbi:hypothetical protein CHU98_g11932 [Xylaria longipes]|nr:hypothetical protein CHU98_g11932 [Xylaria longipes]